MSGCSPANPTGCFGASYQLDPLGTVPTPPPVPGTSGPGGLQFNPGLPAVVPPLDPSTVPTTLTPPATIAAETPAAPASAPADPYAGAAFREPAPTVNPGGFVSTNPVTGEDYGAAGQPNDATFVEQNPLVDPNGGEPSDANPGGTGLPASTATSAAPAGAAAASTVPSAITDWRDALTLLGISYEEIDAEGGLEKYLDKRDLDRDDLEDGITWEEARKLGSDMTEAYYEILSTGGRRLEGDGKVEMDDIRRFNEKVIQKLSAGTGKPEEILAKYLHTGKFKMIDSRRAVELFSEKFGANSTLFSGDTINVKALIGSYTNTELQDLACVVLSNILGQPVTKDNIDAALTLTKEQLETYFITMYFLGKVDNPSEILESAQGRPKLDGDTPEHLLAWLTKGTSNAVTEPSASTSTSSASGSSETSGPRTIAGELAWLAVKQRAEYELQGSNPTVDMYLRAINIYRRALSEGKLSQIENGAMVEITLQLTDAEKALIEQQVQEVSKGIVALLMQSAGQNVERQLTVIRSALAGSVTYNGQTIAISLTAEFKEQLIQSLAGLLYQTGLAKTTSGTPNFEQGLSLLFEARQLILENPNSFVGVTTSGGQEYLPSIFASLVKTLQQMAAAGLVVNPELTEKVQALKQAMLNGEYDAYMRVVDTSNGQNQWALIPGWNPAQAPSGARVVPSDEATFDRWKRHYIALIAAVLAGQAYTGNIPLSPGMQDSDNKNNPGFGWGLPISGSHGAPVPPTLAQLGASSESTPTGAAQGATQPAVDEDHELTPLQQAQQWGSQQAATVITTNPTLTQAQKTQVRQAARAAARSAFQAHKTEAEIKAAALAAAQAKAAELLAGAPPPPPPVAVSNPDGGW